MFGKKKVEPIVICQTNKGADECDIVAEIRNMKAELAELDEVNGTNILMKYIKANPYYRQMTRPEVYMQMLRDVRIGKKMATYEETLSSLGRELDIAEKNRNRIYFLKDEIERKKKILGI